MKCLRRCVDEFATIEMEIAKLQKRLGKLPQRIDDAAREINKAKPDGGLRACDLGEVHEDVGAAFLALSSAQSAVMEAHCRCIKHVGDIVPLPKPRFGR